MARKKCDSMQHALARYDAVCGEKNKVDMIGLDWVGLAYMWDPMALVFFLYVSLSFSVAQGKGTMFIDTLLAAALACRISRGTPGVTAQSITEHAQSECSGRVRLYAT